MPERDGAQSFSKTLKANCPKDIKRPGQNKLSLCIWFRSNRLLSMDVEHNKTPHLKAQLKAPLLELSGSARRCQSKVPMAQRWSTSQHLAPQNQSRVEGRSLEEQRKVLWPCRRSMTKQSAWGAQEAAFQAQQLRRKEFQAMYRWIKKQPTWPNHPIQADHSLNCASFADAHDPLIFSS